MAVANETKIILTSSNDWEEWQGQFRAEAEASCLWEKIDPDAYPKEPFMTAPERPPVGEYEKKRIVTRVAGSRTYGTRASSTSATPEESSTVEEVDLSGTPATHINQLTTAGRSAFNIAWNMYTQEVRDYDKEIKEIQSVKKWIRSTISSHLFRTCCETSNKIDIWYA
jgi:hypothetical protein